ncbi:MAG: ferric reductase-like transmembrane domain-containing protein [Terriglobales bacterium]
MTAIDLSGNLGLAALALLTLNILLGLLISVRYDPWRHLGDALRASGRQLPGIEASPPSDQRERPRQKVASHLRAWPYQRWDIFHLHNWTGYIALAASALHPLPLLASARLPFSWGQIAWPVHAPSQPAENLIGALGLYLVAVVVLTSYFRVALGRKSWKLIHYLSYAAAALFFLHSLLLDPELQNRPVDWLDAEKVFVEVCLLLVVVASLARWKYGQRHPLRLRVTPGTRYVPGFKGSPRARSARESE